MEMDSPFVISRSRFDAILFDLDGVVTQTARLHIAAWKTLFDDFLKRRAESGGLVFRPFDPEADYRRYVDGKPRSQGVTAFLAARGIDLPFGKPSDPADLETVCGLGNRKNALYLDLLERQGAEVYASTIALIRTLRAREFQTAVVTASKNCSEVLRSTGIEGLFDAQVDGWTLENEGLAGKPAPDSFLAAAQVLEVPPARAIVVEDALAGVEAGRRGGFGCVIGVNRAHQAEALRQAGADAVVADLGEVRVA